MARRAATKTRVQALVAGAVAWASIAGPARAEPAEKPSKEAPPELDPPLFRDRSVASIGSLSVGHPHAGFLVNGVRMPQGESWVVSVPAQAWGTEETIQSLIHCIRRVNEQFPDSPKAIVGAISAERGGPLKPHKSHRTGRDVDVYLYRIGNKKRWYEPAGPDDLDRARNWALLRALIMEADVEFVLLDRSIQILLEEYALSIGEDPAWVEDLFHGKDRYQRSLIKHIAGHTAHMHIRFVSAVSRERGRLAYDGLVALGHIEPPSRELVHRVAAGETLIGIARQYSTTLDELRRQNQLGLTPLRVGQMLRIRERTDIRGARDAVIVPPRRLPTNERQEQTPTLAELKELERELTAPLASGPADSEPHSEPPASPDPLQK